MLIGGAANGAEKKEDEIGFDFGEWDGVLGSEEGDLRGLEAMGMGMNEYHVGCEGNGKVLRSVKEQFERCTGVVFWHTVCEDSLQCRFEGGVLWSEVDASNVDNIEQSLGGAWHRFIGGTMQGGVEHQGAGTFAGGQQEAR